MGYVLEDWIHSLGATDDDKDDYSPMICAFLSFKVHRHEATKVRGGWRERRLQSNYGNDNDAELRMLYDAQYWLIHLGLGPWTPPKSEVATY